MCRPCVCTFVMLGVCITFITATTSASGGRRFTSVKSKLCPPCTSRVGPGTVQDPK